MRLTETQVYSLSLSALQSLEQVSYPPWNCKLLGILYISTSTPPYLVPLEQLLSPWSYDYNNWSRFMRHQFRHWHTTTYWPGIYSPFIWCTNGPYNRVLRPESHMYCLKTNVAKTFPIGPRLIHGPQSLKLKLASRREVKSQRDL